MKKPQTMASRRRDAAEMSHAQETFWTFGSCETFAAVIIRIKIEMKLNDSPSDVTCAFLVLAGIVVIAIYDNVVRLNQFNSNGILLLQRLSPYHFL